MELNGSILTRGGQNILPIDTLNKQYFNSCVKLHLDMEGVNNGVQFTDSSLTARQVINVDDSTNSFVRTVNSDKKFGTTSAYFNGTSNLVCLNNSDFTFPGLYTIGFWMKSNTYSLDNTGVRRIISFGEGSIINLEIIANTSAGTNDKISVYNNSWHDGTISAFNNTWNHILLSRDSLNVNRLFVNGNISVSFTDATIYFCQYFEIGRIINSPTGHYVGFLDDLFVLNGICLHTTSFTPPTEPFSLYNVSDIDTDYSGITIDGKLGQDIKKGQPLYFDMGSNTWKLSKSNSSSTLPAKCVAVDDYSKDEIGKFLTFGTLKIEKENDEYQDYTSAISSGLNSNYYNGYWVRRSSTYSDGNYEAWKAFYPSRNKVFNQFSTGVWYIYWVMGGGYNNYLSWIQIQLPVAKKLKSYTFRGRGGYTNQNPERWNLKGSNDGMHWDLIDSHCGYSTWSDNQSRTFYISNPKSYLYYQFFDISMMGLGQILMYDDSGNDMVPNMSSGTLTNAFTMTYNGYTITWNQHYSTGFAGWYAFNKTTSGPTCWYSSYQSSPYNEYETCTGAQDSNNVLIGGGILDILLPNPIKLDVLGYYHVPWSRGSGAAGYFELYGSNDGGVNWDHLVTWNYMLGPTTEQIADAWPYLFNIDNPKYYSQYRFAKIGSSVFGFDFLTKTKKDSTSLYVQPDNYWQYKHGLDDNISCNPEYYIQKCGYKIGNIIEDSTSISSVNFYNFETSYYKTTTNNLGDVTVSANTNITSLSDGDLVTAVYDSLIINSSYTLTVSNRCRGFRVVVFGDCTINGTLSMTARGANYPPPDEDLPIYDLNGNILAYVPRIGGLGAAPQSTNGAGLVGVSGSDGSCGGGGGGGGYCFASGGYRGGGGQASCYSGGAGGGGFAPGSCSTLANNSMDGRDFGGRGGDGYFSSGASDSYYCRAGVGNPGGGEWYRSGSFIGHAPSGTGGLLILIVYGNLIIGSTGIICSDGISANSGSTTCLGGGGGSGGGSINIFHKGNLINNGTVRANGGIGTTTTYSSNIYAGGNGGSGSIRFFQLS